MALAVASKNTATADSSGTTLVITKPTGLAEGDLMIAFLGTMQTTSDWTSSGWTKVTSISSSPFFDSTDGNHTCLAKTATAGDAAASNFTFTVGSGTGERVGILYRITRTEGTADWPTASTVISNLIVSDADAVIASTSDVFTGGVTPIKASSLLLMTVISNSNATSGYAVTTSNPTWTEEADVEGNVVTAATINLASASAVRTEATATGDYQISQAGTTSKLAILISLSESIDASVTLDVATLTGTPRDFAAVTGGAGVTLDVASMTATAQTLTAAASAPKWVNTDKSSAGSITNTDKS